MEDDDDDTYDAVGSSLASNEGIELDDSSINSTDDDRSSAGSSLTTVNTAGTTASAAAAGGEVLSPRTPLRSNLSQATVPSTPTTQAEVVAKPKQTHSIAHDDMESGRLMIFHVDLEHGGDHCGVVQISVVVYDPVTRTQLATFNSYIKPSDKAATHFV